MRVLLLLPGLFALMSAQHVPSIPCPQYFEYLAFNQEFIGRISIPHDPRYGNNTIYVEFSQRNPINSNYVGRLSLFQDEQTTKFNLGNGVPIQYRVDFPTPGVLPKLTQILVNDALLCSASPYPPPNTLISLTHTLRFSPVPLRGGGGPVFVTTQRPIFRPTVRRQIVVSAPQFQQKQTQQLLQPEYSIEPQAPPATPAPVRSPQLPLSDICGRETSVIEPFIFHGRPVQRGKLPWMAAIFEKQANGLSFFCGGTLISRSTVVSAAHCFRVGRDLPASRTVVSLGRISLDDYSSGVLRDIEILVVHQQYRDDAFSDADIALLKLVQPVTFDDFIKPICLWNENNRLELPSGQKTYVAGWGADEKGNAITKVAKMTDTDIVSENDCLRLLPTKLVTSRTICAANKVGAGPCQGDSGGGLMINENNVWLIRGIVSAGLANADACDLSKPVIYCDLAKHIQWVRASMWN